MDDLKVNDLNIDYIFKISDKLNNKIQELDLSSISFCYSSKNCMHSMLNDDEEQFVLSYMQKYDDLIGFESFNIESLNNPNIDIVYSESKGILNDYRPIIMNQNDISYYSNIGSFCTKKMKIKDKGTIEINIKNIKGVDVTDNYITFIKYSLSIIRHIIEGNDFKYVYNGILQHSESTYLKRVEKDKKTGEIKIILDKHVIACMAIKECLHPITSVLIAMRGFIC